MSGSWTRPGLTGGDGMAIKPEPNDVTRTRLAQFIRMARNLPVKSTLCDAPQDYGVDVIACSMCDIELSCRLLAQCLIRNQREK
jgi:hypothetical protein